MIFKGQNILMVERGRSPLKGYWSLPGGVLEAGEHLAEAIQREVEEETGLKVSPLTVVEIFERIMRDKEGKPEYHYVLIDYLCKITGGELRAGDDSTKVEWVKRKDLPKLKITEGTLEVIERTFDKRKGRVGAAQYSREHAIPEAPKRVRLARIPEMKK